MKRAFIHNTTPPPDYIKKYTLIKINAGHLCDKKISHTCKQTATKCNILNGVQIFVVESIPDTRHMTLNQGFLIP